MSKTVGDLAIEIAVAPPLATVECCATMHATLSLILEGAVFEGDAVLVPGTVTYRPAAWNERFTIGARGCTLVRLELETERLAPFGLTHPRRARITDYATLGGRIRREMQRSDAAAPLALRSAALQLVGRAIRVFGRDTRPAWLTGACEVIAARFRERIHPRDVAAAVGVAPSTLSRAFRRELGASVAGAIRAARIEAAVGELRGSTTSTAAIAAHCGFYDASHLIRNLQASIGLTPSALREFGVR